MGKLGYSSITLTDLTDTLPVSLVLESNLNKNIQMKNGNLYQPNFEEEGGDGVIITPSLYLGQEDLFIEENPFYVDPTYNGKKRDSGFIYYEIGSTKYFYGSNSDANIYVDEDGKLHIKKNLKENITIEAYIKDFYITEHDTYVELVRATNPINILFLEEGSNKYYAVIECKDGREHFEERNAADITMYATLYKGNDILNYKVVNEEKISEEGFSYSWEKLSDGNTDSDGSDFFYTVRRIDIINREHYTCIITDNETGLTYQATKIIQDFTDTYDCNIEYDKMPIFTTKENKITLTAETYYRTTLLDKDEKFNLFYEWTALGRSNGVEVPLKTSNPGEKDNKLIIDSSALNKNLQKQDFIVYCKVYNRDSENNDSQIAGDTIDIKYSEVYSTKITPSTIFVPTSSEGKYQGDASKIYTFNFQLLGEDGSPLGYNEKDEYFPEGGSSISGDTTKITFSQPDSSKWSFKGTLKLDIDEGSLWNSTDNSRYYTFSYTYLGQVFSEEILVVKQVQGKDGVDGKDGEQGYSGYTVELSNEFHSFAGGEAIAEPDQVTNCKVSVYKGTDLLNIRFIKAKREEENDFYTIYNSTNASHNAGESIFNFGNENLFLRPKLESDGVNIEITSGKKEGGKFLSKIFPLFLEIQVEENGKTLSFLKTFKYTINYNSKSYYLDFTENGKPCNEILYSKVEDSYSPSSFTVKAYSRDSATGAASEYTNGNIVYSVDGTTWKNLGTNGLIKDYSNLSKIYVRLYSAAAKDFSISNLDNFSKYLLDQESIPILTDIKGYEFGGENLIKWSKTIPLETNKWQKSSALSLGLDGDFSVMEFNITKDTDNNPDDTEWYSFSTPKIPLTDDIRDKKLCLSFLFKCENFDTFAPVTEGGKTTHPNYPLFICSASKNSSGSRDIYGSIGTIRDTIERSGMKFETFEEGKWCKVYKVFELSKSLFDSTEQNYTDKNGNGKYDDGEIEGFSFSDCKYFWIQFYLKNLGIFQIKQPKLEIGNVPSAWSASPYDIDFSNVSGANLLSYGSSYRIDIYGKENGGYVDIPIGNFDTIGDYTFSWGDVVNNYKDSSLTKFYIELYQTGGSNEVRKYSKTYELHSNSFTQFIDFSEGLIRIHAKKDSSSVANENEHLTFYCLKVEKGNIATPYTLDNSQIVNIANIINTQGQSIADQKVKIETIEGTKYVTPDKLEEYFKQNTGSYITADKLNGSIKAATNEYLTGKPEKSAEAYFQQIQRSVKIVTSREEDPSAPYVQIGVYEGDQTASEKMNFYTKIAADKLSFYQNSTEVAFISQDSLMINRAHFLDSFIIGNSNSGQLKVSVTKSGVGFLWEG